MIYDDELGAKAKAAAAAAHPPPDSWAHVSELADGAASPAGSPVMGDLVDTSAPHAIIYTSGSSGEPKGVVLTLSNLMWNAISVGFRVGATSDDRWLLCLPLFHIGGYSILFRGSYTAAASSSTHGSTQGASLSPSTTTGSP